MENLKENKILTVDDLLFPVKLIKNPVNSNSEYSRIVRADIDGKNWDLNYCSPRYELVKNADIFPNIINILNDNNISFSDSYRMIDNSRFYAEYKLTDTDFLYKIADTNDTIQPIINVQHSYNGLTKYSITLGYFRFICSNGLIIPVEELKKYNFVISGKHTTQIKQSFQQLQFALNYFIENKDIVKLALTSKYETLNKNFVLKPEERIIEVLAAADIAAIDNKKFNTVEHILEGIKTEAQNKKLGYNGKITDWLIYNGVNQYINDDERFKSVPEIREKTDKKVFNFLLEA